MNAKIETLDSTNEPAERIVYFNGGYSIQKCRKDERKVNYSRKDKREALRVTEKASKKDRAWFANNPERTIYVRSALNGEVKALAVLKGVEQKHSWIPDNANYMIVEQEEVGVRRRLPISSGAPLDQTDEITATVLKMIVLESQSVGADKIPVELFNARMFSLLGGGMTQGGISKH